MADTVRTLRVLVSNEGLSAAQWMEIGTQLKLKHSTLMELGITYPHSPEKCLLEVLHRWLRNHNINEFKSALR